MLAIGTDYEYYNAVWVKNEWSRFLKLMEQDKTKHLIPCFKGIDAYDMPKEFNKLQAQDLGKVGATQDLLRGIEKLIAPAKAEKPAVVDGKGLIAETWEKAQGFILAKEWKSADMCLDTVRGYEPEHVGALIGKLMVSLKVSQEAELASCGSILEENEFYPQLLRVADKETAARMKDYNCATIYNAAMADAKKPGALAANHAIAKLKRINGYFAHTA